MTPAVASAVSAALLAHDRERGGHLCREPGSRDDGCSRCIDPPASLDERIAVAVEAAVAQAAGERDAMSAMLDRIARVDGVEFDPAQEECVADGVDALADALKDTERERDGYRADFLAACERFDAAVVGRDEARAALSALESWAAEARAAIAQGLDESEETVSDRRVMRALLADPAGTAAEARVAERVREARDEECCWIADFLDAAVARPGNPPLTLAQLSAAIRARKEGPK